MPYRYFEFNLFRGFDREGVHACSEGHWFVFMFPSCPGIALEHNTPKSIGTPKLAETLGGCLGPQSSLALLLLVSVALYVKRILVPVYYCTLSICRLLSSKCQRRLNGFTSRAVTKVTSSKKTNDDGFVVMDGFVINTG